MRKPTIRQLNKKQVSLRYFAMELYSLGYNEEQIKQLCEKFIQGQTIEVQNQSAVLNYQEKSKLVDESITKATMLKYRKSVHSKHTEGDGKIRVIVTDQFYGCESGCSGVEVAWSDKREFFHDYWDSKEYPNVKDFVLNIVMAAIGDFSGKKYWIDFENCKLQDGGI